MATISIKQNMKINDEEKAIEVLQALNNFHIKQQFSTKDKKYPERISF